MARVERVGEGSAPGLIALPAWAQRLMGRARRLGARIGRVRCVRVALAVGADGGYSPETGEVWVVWRADRRELCRNLLHEVGHASVSSDGTPWGDLSVAQWYVEERGAWLSAYEWAGRLGAVWALGLEELGALLERCKAEHGALEALGRAVGCRRYCRLVELRAAGGALGLDSGRWLSVGALLDGPDESVALWQRLEVAHGLGGEEVLRAAMEAAYCMEGDAELAAVRLQEQLSVLRSAAGLGYVAWALGEMLWDWRGSVRMAVEVPVREDGREVWRLAVGRRPLGAAAVVRSVEVVVDWRSAELRSVAMAWTRWIASWLPGAWVVEGDLEGWREEVAVERLRDAGAGLLGF